MKDESAPRGAILQRDKKTYAIVPRTPLGLITPDALEAIAAVVRKFSIPIIKITSGQRMALVGLKAEEVEPVWEELKMRVGPAIELCVHYVQACPGTAVCAFGVRDSLGLGMKLEELFVGNIDLPAKVKVGVSGCPMCCGESFMRDLGFLGRKNGWTVIFGGNSGGRPRIGDVVATDVSDERAVELAGKLLDFYKANAKRKERTARFVEKTGIEEIKKALGLTS